MKQRSRGLTALVCEDDPTIRRMIETVLQRDGFRVASAPDGDVAVARLEEHDFDLIVLDLMMPGLNGFDVLAFLERRKPSRLKRVLITTAVPPTLAEKLPSTICHVLPKPFDIDEFLAYARECSEDTLTRRTRMLLVPTPG
jgi:DNA-binding response OmpR family regulator